MDISSTEKQKNSMGALPFIDIAYNYGPANHGKMGYL